VRFALGTPGEVESPIFVASHFGDFIRAFTPFREPIAGINRRRDRYPALNTRCNMKVLFQRRSEFCIKL
jgi:hypothetical protein